MILLLSSPYRSLPSLPAAAPLFPPPHPPSAPPPPPTPPPPPSRTTPPSCTTPPSSTTPLSRASPRSRAAPRSPLPPSPCGCQGPSPCPFFAKKGPPGKCPAALIPTARGKSILFCCPETLSCRSPVLPGIPAFWQRGAAPFRLFCAPALPGQKGCLPRCACRRALRRLPVSGRRAALPACRLTG